MRSNKKVAEMISQVKELERAKKELEDKIDSLKSSLKEELKVRNTKLLTVEGYTIKVTTCNSSKFDTSRFKKDFDKLYREYSMENSYERFYILKEGK